MAVANFKNVVGMIVVLILILWQLGYLDWLIDGDDDDPVFEEYKLEGEVIFDRIGVDEFALVESEVIESILEEFSSDGAIDVEISSVESGSAIVKYILTFASGSDMSNAANAMEDISRVQSIAEIATVNAAGKGVSLKVISVPSPARAVKISGGVDDGNDNDGDGDGDVVPIDDADVVPIDDADDDADVVPIDDADGDADVVPIGGSDDQIAVPPIPPISDGDGDDDIAVPPISDGAGDDVPIGEEIGGPIPIAEFKQCIVENNCSDESGKPELHTVTGCSNIYWVDINGTGEHQNFYLQYGKKFHPILNFTDSSSLNFPRFNVNAPPSDNPFDLNCIIVLCDIFAIWTDITKLNLIHDDVDTLYSLCAMIVATRSDCLLNLSLRDPPQISELRTKPIFQGQDVPCFVNIYLWHTDDIFESDQWARLAMGNYVNTDQYQLPYVSIAWGARDNWPNWLHELFHIFQYQATNTIGRTPIQRGYSNLSGEGRWIIESSATWYASRWMMDWFPEGGEERNKSFRQAFAMSAAPHYNLWHNHKSKRTTDLEVPGDWRNYDSAIFLHYLEYFGVDPRIITSGFYFEDVEITPQYYYWQNIPDFHLIFGRFCVGMAAHINFIEYGIFQKACYNYSYVRYDRTTGDVNRNAFYRPYIDQIECNDNLPNEFFGEVWIRPPVGLAPRNYGYNVIKIRNDYYQSFSFNCIIEPLVGDTLDHFQIWLVKIDEDLVVREEEDITSLTYDSTTGILSYTPNIISMTEYDMEILIVIVYARTDGTFGNAYGEFTYKYKIYSDDSRLQRHMAQDDDWVQTDESFPTRLEAVYICDNRRYW